MTVTSSERHPVPEIDAKHCNGCGICVRVCPTNALALCKGVAIVARPDVCRYHGNCEIACPTQAITRPFEIVFS